MISNSKTEKHIKHFLKTGQHDAMSLDWPGDWLARAKQADREMRQALVEAVTKRAAGLPAPDMPVLDLQAFTRNKVEPVVNGLFPEAERANVLDMLEKSLVFVTGDSIYDILQRERSLHTVWTLANLYLYSIGAKPLGDTAPSIVGLSEETTCYVSHEYFTHQGRFEDFVVHEAAHVFHNCKRQTAGLPETRRREFLLDIGFCQRETFAYACEVYSRILELGGSLKERLELVSQVEREFLPPDARVDIARFKTALLEAAGARNGWKKILQACAPPKRLSVAELAKIPAYVPRH